MSRNGILMSIMLLFVLSNPLHAHADCEERTCKTVTFNVVCNYKKDKEQKGFEKCQSASQFQKTVWDNGAEIEDKSKTPFNPQFEVECDGKVLFNSSAHRFTDDQGTRLQAESGPFPATVLPWGSLRDEHKYVQSTLELNDQVLRGYCYIYTGPR